MRICWPTNMTNMTIPSTRTSYEDMRWHAVAVLMHLLAFTIIGLNNVLAQVGVPSNKRNDIELSTTASSMASATLARTTFESTKATLSTTSHDRGGGELSFNFQIVLLLLEMNSIRTFIVDNPRKAVLCLILSLAFGISLLIVYMLIIACYKRYRVKKTDSSTDVCKDEADGVKQILLAKPLDSSSAVEQSTFETVLVTRQNGVALHETTISSDSTLTTRNKKSKHAEVISTIKRTHSVDEGTQTDGEEFDEPTERRRHQPRTLSMQEAQELGDLVNVMNYYNSRIDDDDAFYPQFSSSFTVASSVDNANANNNNSKNINNNNTNNTSMNSKYLSHKNATASADMRYKHTDGSQYANSDGARSTTLASPLLPRNNSNTPIPPSPYHLRHNNIDWSKKKSLSRNPSELSYNTSASESSLGNYSPDAIFNGENLRHPSIQRTPKLGVRGDGYEFIGNSASKPSNK